MKLSKEIIKQIKSWIEDFEKTQPNDVSIDDETFDGSAYYLFQTILAENK